MKSKQYWIVVFLMMAMSLSVCWAEECEIVKKEHKGAKVNEIQTDDRTEMEWDPFQEMTMMEKQMGQLFRNSMNRFRMNPEYGYMVKQGDFSPALDLKEEKDNYVVSIDAPGVEKTDIKVDLDGVCLRISGKRNMTDEKKEGDRLIRRERYSGEFLRMFRLPGPVKEGGAKATLEKGVLTVVIPKAPEVKRGLEIPVL